MATKSGDQLPPARLEPHPEAAHRRQKDELGREPRAEDHLRERAEAIGGQDPWRGLDGHRHRVEHTLRLYRSAERQGPLAASEK